MHAMHLEAQLDTIDAAILADLDAPAWWQASPRPEPTQREIEMAAEQMLMELAEQRLEVVLIPSLLPDVAERGGMIRAAVNRNPQWYQQLCSQYPPQRTKPRRGKRGERDTAIKRRHVLRALEEIASGNCATEYARRLMPFVKAKAKEST